MKEGNDKRPANPLTRPLSERGLPKWVVYAASALAAVYLLNPTLGIFEIIPDNLPLVGNLDEGGAALLVWYGLLEMVESRRRKREREKQKITPTP